MEFSVYIIDWLIPDMNGIEIVRQIRKVIGKSRPIIILTAYDWADIEEEARAGRCYPPSVKSRCSSRSCAECWQSRSVQSLPAGRCS